MNAQEIIELIRSSKKQTPVRVYLREKNPILFENVKAFPMGNGTSIVFGDWSAISPVLTAHAEDIDELVVENDCRNSAIPLLDKKNINARIEPGAIIRDQV